MIRVAGGLAAGVALAVLVLKGGPAIARWAFSQGDDRPVTLRELGRQLGHSLAA